MTKIEFLAQLKSGLNGIDNYIIEDILNDYEEYFINGKEEGKSEDEICKELGTPHQIIQNLCEQGVINKNQLQSFNKNKEEKYNVVSIIALVILNFVILSALFPIVSSILGLAIGLVVAIPLLLIGTCTTIVAVISSTIPLFSIFIMITILSIAILILIGIYFLGYYGVKLGKQYINWNIKVARG